jgi:hypothetical protein
MTKFGSLNDEPLAWTRVTKIDTSADYQRFVEVYGKKQPQPQKPKPQQ